MEQLIINIENPKILPSLKRVLKSINGISVLSTRKKKTGLEEAMDDIKAGRVNHYQSAEDMFKALGI